MSNFRAESFERACIGMQRPIAGGGAMAVSRTCRSSLSRAHTDHFHPEKHVRMCNFSNSIIGVRNSMQSQAIYCMCDLISDSPPAKQVQDSRAICHFKKANQPFFYDVVRDVARALLEWCNISRAYPKQRSAFLTTRSWGLF